jgi:hypothetical protein
MAASIACTAARRRSKLEALARIEALMRSTGAELPVVVLKAL